MLTPALRHYHYGRPPWWITSDWESYPYYGIRAAESRALGDHLSITAKYHRDLSGYEVDYPVAESAFSGQRSIWHSGPEQTKIYDGPVPVELRGYSPSGSWVLLGILGVLGIAAWRAL